MVAEGRLEVPRSRSCKVLGVLVTSHGASSPFAEIFRVGHVSEARAQCTVRPLSASRVPSFDSTWTPGLGRNQGRRESLEKIVLACAASCHLGSPYNDGRHFYFLRPGWALICIEYVVYQAPCIMVHLIFKDPGSRGHTLSARCKRGN